MGGRRASRPARSLAHARDDSAQTFALGIRLTIPTLMKIRTQLILICFLLAVLPLSGIVIYSYYASRRALEGAYHAEATRMTAQMDRRLGVIRDDLEQRLAEVSSLPALSDMRASQPAGTCGRRTGRAVCTGPSLTLGTTARKPSRSESVLRSRR